MKEKEEVEKDLPERVEKFNKELVLILAKYDLGLGAVAFLTPDGRIGAQPQLVSSRKPKEEKKQQLPRA